MLSEAIDHYAKNGKLERETWRNELLHGSIQRFASQVEGTRSYLLFGYRVSLDSTNDITYFTRPINYI